jgi:hypothetical protein
MIALGQKSICYRRLTGGRREIRTVYRPGASNSMDLRGEILFVPLCGGGVERKERMEDKGR